MRVFHGILLVCLLRWASASDHKEEIEFEHSQYLHHNVLLEWKFEDDDIIMKLSVDTTSWIGVGLSPGTTMAGADIIIGGVYRGKGYLFDAFAKENGAPEVDKTKDVTLIRSKQENFKTSITFKRKIKNADPFDRDITDGEMNVIWAYGLGDIKRAPGLFNYHLWRRGSTKVNFFPDFKNDDFKYSVELHEDVTLDWYYNNISLTFRFSAPSHGWVGFGFSRTDTMVGGDMVMGGINSGKPYCFDVYSLKNGPPIYDEDQNTEILKVTREGKKITLVVRARLDTAGKHDVPIKKNMTIIWAHGPLKIINEHPRFFNYHLWNRGAKEIVLLPVPINETLSEPVLSKESDMTPPLSIGTDLGKMGGYTTLDRDGDVTMVWGFNGKKIVITITAPTTGWVGVGFSKTGGMAGADIIIAGVNENNQNYIWDAYATENGPPQIDVSQDVQLIAASQNSTSTNVMFTKKLKSSESNDFSITSEDIYVIWAFGSQDMTGKPNDDYYHGSNRGAKRMNFMAS